MRMLVALQHNRAPNCGKNGIVEIKFSDEIHRRKEGNKPAPKTNSWL